MLQRPQTLLFLIAAVITAIITFIPFCSYQPSESNSEDNSRIAVSASDISFRVDYNEKLHGDKERFQKSVDEFNQEIDARLEEGGVSMLLTIGMVGMLLLAAFIALLAFLFKNRKLQIRLGILASFVTIGVTIAVFVASRVGLRIFAEINILPQRLSEYKWDINYSLGFFLLPVVIGLLLAGVILVRKDDNLVKSIDRIR